jgi:anti-sigma B factor antagonist
MEKPFMDQLQTLTMQDNERVIISVQGEITAETAGKLTELFRGVLAQHPTQILIDLAGTSYIASVGIGALVSFLRKVNQGGAELALQGLQPEVHDLFRVTHLDRVFKIVDQAPQPA